MDCATRIKAGGSATPASPILSPACPAGERCVGTGADERCKVAVQTNNVEVDDRGHIYIVDRANTGLHILELTGSARQVANLP